MYNLALSIPNCHKRPNGLHVIILIGAKAILVDHTPIFCRMSVPSRVWKVLALA